MRSKKILCLVLCAMLCLLTALGGCSGSGSAASSSAATTAAATTAAAAQTTAAAKTTAAATTAAATTAATSAAQAPAKISMFLSTLGNSFPDGVDFNDNPYINAMKEKANVEITEMTVPPYSDYDTNLQLLLSSGSLPDIVNLGWESTNIGSELGSQGAFVELEDIIRKSPVLSKHYDDEMIDMMRFTDDKIYRIKNVVGTGVDPDCVGVRYDLLVELNDGVVPQNVYDWYDFWVKVKAKYPDSVPVSDYGGGLTRVFDAMSNGFGVANYGRDRYGWSYVNGSYMHVFANPNFTEMINFYKKLYDEKILSQTFVTNTREDFQNELFNFNVTVRKNNLTAVLSLIRDFSDPNTYTGDADVQIVPVPYYYFRLNDQVDPEYFAVRTGKLSGNALAISSSTKDLDACVRFVETMFDDEILELTSWGVEGTDWYEENGVKYATKDAPTNAYRGMYTYLFGDIMKIEAEAASYYLSIDDEKFLADYKALVEDYSNTVIEQVLDNPSINMNNYISIDNEDVSLLQTEATEYAKTLMVKYVVGEISEADFKTECEAFLKKYQKVTDEYNKQAAIVREKYGIK